MLGRGVRMLYLPLFIGEKGRGNLFIFKIIYLFMRYTQREAETWAEGEAGSLLVPVIGVTP